MKNSLSDTSKKLFDEALLGLVAGDSQSSTWKVRKVDGACNEYNYSSYAQPLYRICACCGATEYGKLLYTPATRNDVGGEKAHWSTPMLITVGFIKKEEVLPWLSKGRNHIKLEAERSDMLITWDDV